MQTTTYKSKCYAQQKIQLWQDGFFSHGSLLLWIQIYKFGMQGVVGIACLSEKAFCCSHRNWICTTTVCYQHFDIIIITYISLHNANLWYNFRMLIGVNWVEKYKSRMQSSVKSSVHAHGVCLEVNLFTIWTQVKSVIYLNVLPYRFSTWGNVIWIWLNKGRDSTGNKSQTEYWNQIHTSIYTSTTSYFFYLEHFSSIFREKRWR